LPPAWITESKERIDIDMLAIKAGQYIEVSTQITGWPTRTAKSPTARPPTTHSYLFPSISHGLSAQNSVERTIGICRLSRCRTLVRPGCWQVGEPAPLSAGEPSPSPRRGSVPLLRSRPAASPGPGAPKDRGPRRRLSRGIRCRSKPRGSRFPSRRD